MTQKTNHTIGIVAYSKYYTEYRDAMCKAFNLMGWKASTYIDIESSENSDIIIIVGMAFFSHVPYLKGKTVIGIQGEHLPLSTDTDWSLKRNLKRFKSMSFYYDLVIEWNPANYLNHSCSVPRFFIPFGSPQSSNTEKIENWDVVFLGNPFGGKGRRIPILKRLDESCNLCPTREAWGEEKFELLNSAKICLNLHQFETFSFESPRIFELLSEGIFILSERITNSFPFEDGVHYVSFKDIDDLVDKVKYYCEKPEERKAIAKQGKEKADIYKQEHMFELLSIEIEQTVNNRAYEIIRLYRWTKGTIGNLIIEFIDYLAKVKNKMLGIQKKL